MLQNLKYLKEFLSFLSVLDSFPFSHTLFPFLQLLSLPQGLTCGHHTSIEICNQMHSPQSYRNDVLQPYDLQLCFQSCPTRPHKEVSCLCQLPVPKKQRIGRSINQGGSAKVMKSCIDLADRKRLGWKLEQD